MMTSKKLPASVDQVFVWTWLPNRTEPVVAGALYRTARGIEFAYGRSYLARTDRVSIYLPELPLREGLLALEPGLNIPGSIRDAAPDAWGRRVILNQFFSSANQNKDTAEIDELQYLLLSGSDRVGALDFQSSPVRYVARDGGDPTLTQLLESAARIEQGLPLSPALNPAIQHGTEIGGARPKATLTDKNRKWIAKFSSSTDIMPVVKAEFIAMRLATLAGVNAAPVKLERVAGKDVLLVERFDRELVDGSWHRRGLVSALTLLQLDEMMAAYASYQDLAEIIRHRFADPRENLRELFARLVFNILVGNTDDHARNHAAFWNGADLTLTPAYDICPQMRTGQEATQAMKIFNDNRFSQLSLCVEAAGEFLVTKDDACEIVRQQIESIKTNWHAVCDEASLGAAEREFMWERQFLNPFALQGVHLN